MKLLTGRLAKAVGIAAVGGGVTYFYLASEPREWVIPIHYPTNIVPNNYWWDVQFSSNLTSWTTIMTNVTGSNVTVAPTSSPSFYRFKGRP